MDNPNALPELIIDNLHAGRVCQITLNRPHKRNALSNTMMVQLDKVLGHLPEHCEVVCLQAAGPVFCAGMCLHDMQQAGAEPMATNLAQAQMLANLLQRLAGLRQITIALLQGPVLGGGVGLVACCDRVLALKQVYWALPELQLGLWPAVIAPFLQRRMPYGEWFDSALAQNRVSAANAQGLVQAVFDDAEAMHACYEQQLVICLAAGPQALQAAKASWLALVPLPEVVLLNQATQALADLRQQPHVQIRLQQRLAP